MTHIASGAILTVASLLCLFWIIPATTSPPDNPNDLAPAFIPTVAMTTLLVLSIVLVLTALPKREEEKELHEEFGDEATGFGKQEAINLGLWILAALVSWLIMNYVGFEPAMTLFIGAVLYFVGLRNYWLLAAVSVAVPIALSQFVWYLFQTEMPGFWR